MEREEKVLEQSRLAKKKISELPIEMVDVNISDIENSRYQTRIMAFEAEGDLEDLARSIEQDGMMELPKIRPLPEDPDHRYELLTGHRRKIAVTTILGWTTMRCQLYKGLSEQWAFKIVLVDNIQRKRLSNYEEGLAFLMAAKEFKMDPVDIAGLFSKHVDDVERKMESAAVLKEMSSLLDGPDILMFQQRCNMKQRELIESLPAKATEVRRQACKMVADGCTVDALEKYVKDYFIMHPGADGRSSDGNSAPSSGKKKTPAINSLAKTVSDIAKHKDAPPKDWDAVATKLESETERAIVEHEEIQQTLDSLVKVTNELKQEAKAAKREKEKEHKFWPTMMNRLLHKVEKQAHCKEDRQMFQTMAETEIPRN